MPLLWPSDSSLESLNRFEELRHRPVNPFKQDTPPSFDGFLRQAQFPGQEFIGRVVQSRQQELLIARTQKQSRQWTGKVLRQDRSVVCFEVRRAELSRVWKNGRKAKR